MSQQMSKAELTTYIRGQLIILIRLAAERGIRIEQLISEVLDFCDLESG